MTKIYNDGTDQYLLFDIYTTSYALYAGSTEGDALPGLATVWSEYKKTDNSDSGVTVSWNATSGQWKAVIPDAAITQNGSAVLSVSGTDLTTVHLAVDVVSEVVTLAGVLTQVQTGTTTIGSNVEAIKTVTDALDVPTTAEIVTAMLAGAYRSGRTLTQLLKVIEIWIEGDDTGLTEGEGTPITRTLTGVGSLVFDIDDNQNRSLDSETLV